MNDCKGNAEIPRTCPRHTRLNGLSWPVSGKNDVQIEVQMPLGARIEGENELEDDEAMVAGFDDGRLGIDGRIASEPGMGTARYSTCFAGEAGFTR